MRRKMRIMMMIYDGDDVDGVGGGDGCSDYDGADYVDDDETKEGIFS